ncbi:light-regulated protein, chloroplastic-like [Lolium rigidum]|uniref:light-regulated protein, chloroplastic-like n=1 Tax=Lolium rigidum TaxID=89674 RepID=UPI001F5CDBD1|nr:light-regulated protein, chloroplastic-like [Lolium rigidum]
MQAAIASPAVLPFAASVSCIRPAARRRSTVVTGTRKMPRSGVCVAAGTGTAEVDYSSNVSVFPMEACDLVGGEACEAAEMYPETKLGGSSAVDVAGSRVREEEVEREYLAYDEPKTVFPGEACDDLGGEFCEAPYQTGVSKE